RRRHPAAPGNFARRARPDLSGGRSGDHRGNRKRNEGHSAMSLRIEISNEHAFPLNEARLKKGVRTVLKDAGIEDGEISIAIVDDAEIHALNRKYLDHDYPTDVLSFVLEEEDGRLDGEIIASSD